jgi:hypothetical protein
VGNFVYNFAYLFKGRGIHTFKRGINLSAFESKVTKDNLSLTPSSSTRQFRVPFNCSILSPYIDPLLSITHTRSRFGLFINSLLSSINFSLLLIDIYVGIVCISLEFTLTALVIVCRVKVRPSSVL